MNQYIRKLTLFIGILLAVSTGVQAQDWADGSFTLWHSFGSQGSGDGQFQQADGIAVDENGLIYVSDYQLHRIQVFQADGTFVRKWGSQGSGTNQFQNPRGLDIGPDGNLYVCDWGNHRICVYQPDGTFVRSWGSFGTGDSQFNNPYRIFVSHDGFVYVADFKNYRVQIFSSNGTFHREIAVVSSVGAAEYPYSMVATRDGDLFIAQGKAPSSYQYPLITKYDQNGSRGMSWAANPRSFYNDRSSVGGMDISAQGNLVYGTKYYRYPTSSFYGACSVSITDQGGGSVYSMQEDASYRCLDIKIGPNGALVKLSGTSVVQVNRWLNRTFPDDSEQFGYWTQIENIQQRAGYPYLDIDFIANSDTGITNANIALCAFLDGNINLAHLIPMRTFVDGTESNLGENVELTADLKRVTWNMAADWSADSGNVQVQAFAQDGPYYLPFNFLTIPAGGGVSTAFQICRTPVTSADLKAAWLFLVASNDPDVELVSGKVYGTSGSFDGVELANDSVTTPSGKNFLWERMSLRDPTTEELTWAKEATIPGIQKWNPRSTVGGRPSKVNEFGLDTGAISGFWAVKQ
jgi:hypothetical protein